MVLRAAELEQRQAAGAAWPEPSSIQETQNETTTGRWPDSHAVGLEQWQILDVAYLVERPQHVLQGLRHQQEGPVCDPNSQAAEL